MESLSSSIGATWPPMPSSHQRLRAFYTQEVIAGAKESDRFLEHFQQAANTMRSNQQVSRVSFRAIAELGSLARLSRSNVATVEAVLPIASSDLGVVYVGLNNVGRQITQQQGKSHLRLLQSALSRPSSSNFADVTVQILDRDQATELAPSFTPLYSVFGYSHAETKDLLGSTANTIAFATIGDQVVSTAMAETGTIAVNGFGDLTLVEITEASTHPDFRRRGLYTSVSRHLISQLVDRRQTGSANFDVIYGESNLAMAGVVYAAQENGRRFSCFDRDELNINNEFFGILPQNFKVNDGVETRTYNDFAVSYVPLQGDLHVG